MAWAAAVVSLVLAVAASPAAAAATLALGAVMALIVAGERDPVVQALAGAAVVEVALRLHWSVATGASGAAVTVALVPLLLAGLVTAGERTRRLIGWTAFAAVGLGLVGGALGGLAALQARTAVDRGVRAGLETFAAGLQRVARLLTGCAPGPRPPSSAKERPW